MRSSTSLIAGGLLLGTGCLSSVEGPELTAQGTVTYGDRIYLVDDSFDPGGDRRNRTAIDNQDSDLPAICSRLTTRIEDVQGDTSTIDALLMNMGFVAEDDGNPLDRAALRSPQNCFLPLDTNVVSGSLTVDATEVTTEMYQLCIDSGFCEAPDPSEAENKDDICEDGDDGFNDCPMVGVSQSEAREYCSFVGRRLPTAFEAIMIRQQGWAASGQREPDDFTAFPTGEAAPADCEDAHLQRFDCGPPERISPPTGAASADAVDAGDVEIFDLTGHVAEWVDDGFPSNRALRDGVAGADASLPWFCIALIEQDDMTGEPECPNISGDMDPFSDVTFPCVYGYYDPNEAPSSLGLDQGALPELPYGLYPVCLTTNTGSFQGPNGALFGGNYVDIDDDTGRVFSRRVEPSPNDPENPQNAFAYGFRCVDDLDIGMGAENFQRLVPDPDFMP